MKRKKGERMRPPRTISAHVPSPDEDEGEVFGEMGWRVEFRKLDGRDTVLIERPVQLLRRDAFLRTRLSRLQLWNSDLNEPAPEVRAIMLVRSLLKASGATEEELSEFLEDSRLGVIQFLARLFQRRKPEDLTEFKQELRGASDFLAHFLWKSALALDPEGLKRLAQAVEAVKNIEAEEEEFHAAVERLGDCFIGLCSDLKRLPTKRELRKAFSPTIDKGRFSVLLAEAGLSWLPDDHNAKGRRRPK